MPRLRFSARSGSATRPMAMPAESSSDTTRAPYDDLRIERAPDAEVDRQQRDDEGRGGEHCCAARDDERLQALAKFAEVGFEL